MLTCKTFCLFSHIAKKFQLTTFMAKFLKIVLYAFFFCNKFTLKAVFNQLINSVTALLKYIKSNKLNENFKFYTNI